MDGKEPTIILCQRVADANPKVDDCTKEKCFKCSEEVWVSPSSKEIHLKEGAEFICLQCAVPVIKDAKPEQFETRLSQLLEIQETLRKIISSN